MLGFRYVKAPPNIWIVQLRDGAAVREGAGLAFWYFAASSSLVAVPLESTEVPFMLRETTSDFQDVTIQGKLVYRIADPRAASSRVNFGVGAGGAGYLSDDPAKLPQRVVALAQAQIRAEVQRLMLEAALAAADAVAAAVKRRLRAAPELAELGIEVLDVLLLAIKAAPETARALEAAAREAILKRADDALYERRNAAIDQERRIKENELATDLAVQVKKRELEIAQLAAQRDAQSRREEMAAQAMEAQVQLETRRKDVVAASAASLEREADARVHGVRALLTEVGKLDPRVLQALALSGGDARFALAQAFQTLAENAGRIGEVNFTPDLLTSLLEDRKRKAA
jgi:regulator of protease activity HflC (stomatin/prohibitin superfamily)